jgi:phosphate transport system permease protein
MDAQSWYRFRQWKSRLMIWLCAAALLVALLPLLSILWEVFSRGVGVINWQFLTRPQRFETTAEGGIANAIWGSFFVVGLASLFAIPIGIMAGIYLSEFGRGRVADTIRFFADILANFPSVVIGLFAFIVFVPIIGHKAVGAAALALAVLMIPLVTRTTEESLRLVPDNIREAAHALGLPGWRVTTQITLSTARASLVTGAMLAFARSFGETAPLILTLGASTFIAGAITDPSNALTTVVYAGASGAYSSYAAAQQRAWGAAALLLLIVLAINISIRFITLRRRSQTGGTT